MTSSVSGGAGGVDARLDDLLALAQLHDEVGDDLRECSLRLAAVVAGLAGRADLVVAAVLSPRTAAVAVAQTTDAAAALLPLAVTTGSSAAFLRLAAGTYREVDEAAARAAQGLRDAAGFGLGLAAPGLALAGGAAYGGSWVLEHGADAIGWDAGSDAVAAAREGALTRAQQLLLEHPGAVEYVIGGAAGLEQGLLAWLPPGARALVTARIGYPGDYEDVVGSLALFFPDGRVELGPGGRRRPDDAVAPLDVSDLLRGVDRRQQRALGALSGEIGVVRLVGADGAVRWVVQLPGTESWALTPDETARDTTTNLHTMAGASTVYTRGVALALERAGVGPDEPVMLVGHSQGGMTAAALAADGGFRARFDVTHVLTAGAPIARADVPQGVQVLALENSHDLVPRLDGLANPDGATMTTVTFDSDRGSVGDNHALAHYAELADQLPVTDPSVQAWRRSADGFLDPRNRVVEHAGERQTISRQVSP